MLSFTGPFSRFALNVRRAFQCRSSVRWPVSDNGLKLSIESSLEEAQRAMNNLRVRSEEASRSISSRWLLEPSEGDQMTPASLANDIAALESITQLEKVGLELLAEAEGIRAKLDDSKALEFTDELKRIRSIPLQIEALVRSIDHCDSAISNE